ncbi:MAG: hypothetical protein J2O49_08330, partial [Sciscionella sp.]|nr:hypothetical protein [Sciscionella sp.]
ITIAPGRANAAGQANCAANGPLSTMDGTDCAQATPGAPTPTTGLPNPLANQPSINPLPSTPPTVSSQPPSTGPLPSSQPPSSAPPSSTSATPSTPSTPAPQSCPNGKTVPYQQTDPNAKPPATSCAATSSQSSDSCSSTQPTTAVGTTHVTSDKLDAQNVTICGVTTLNTRSGPEKVLHLVIGHGTLTNYQLTGPTFGNGFAPKMITDLDLTNINLYTPRFTATLGIPIFGTDTCAIRLTLTPDAIPSWLPMHITLPSLSGCGLDYDQPLITGGPINLVNQWCLTTAELRSCPSRSPSS